jgi:hypothetical protein
VSAVDDEHGKTDLLLPVAHRPHRYGLVRRLPYHALPSLDIRPKTTLPDPLPVYPHHLLLRVPVHAPFLAFFPGPFLTHCPRRHALCSPTRLRAHPFGSKVHRACRHSCPSASFVNCSPIFSAKASFDRNSHGSLRVHAVSGNLQIKNCYVISLYTYSSLL